MTRVFLIDDHAVKHFWFLKILDQANDLKLKSGIPQYFESGFGTDIASAPDKSVNVDSLWSAIQEENALFLVDIELSPLDGVSDFEYSFEQKFKNSDHPALRHAFQLYEEINWQHRLHEMKNKYKVSLLCLLALKELGSPAILASGVVTGAMTREIVNAGLARQVEENFPDQSVGPESVTSAENGGNLPSEPNKLTSERIEAWAKALCELTDGLEHVKMSTRNWFGKGIETGWKSFEDDGLPHTLLPGYAANTVFVERYKRCVRTVFLIAPDSWWKSEAEILSLHECLKGSFGTHAQWMSEAGEYPLCLAGAYFALLIALGDNIKPENSRFLVEDLNCFCMFDDACDETRYPVPIRFLPDATHEVAGISFTSLFDFFRLAATSKYNGALAIGDIVWPDARNQFFGLKLDWPKPDLVAFADSINDVLMPTLRAAGRSEGAALKISPAKTKGAFLRFALASQIRSHGTGAIGRIVLENDPNGDEDVLGWLRIGVQ